MKKRPCRGWAIFKKAPYHLSTPGASLFGACSIMRQRQLSETDNLENDLRFKKAFFRQHQHQDQQSRRGRKSKRPENFCPFRIHFLSVLREKFLNCRQAGGAGLVVRTIVPSRKSPGFSSSEHKNLFLHKSEILTCCVLVQIIY